MDKTAKTEIYRSFLIDGLPEPLTRASSHLQIFDNYIADTRLRLRSVRDPESRGWTRILQQRFPADSHDLATMKVAEIYLNEDEHSRFEPFEGTEIRKNRNFHEFDGRMFLFDVYLGKLWGLNVARVEFAAKEDLEKFEPPPFALFEVTQNAFFLGENIVLRAFEDVQAEVARIGLDMRPVAEVPDE